MGETNSTVALVILYHDDLNQFKFYSHFSHSVGDQKKGSKYTTFNVIDDCARTNFHWFNLMHNNALCIYIYNLHLQSNL